MSLKPEVSLPVSLATGAVVYAIFSNATPSFADMNVSSPDNPALSSANRSATLMATAVVGGISLIARDPTVFIIGGMMTVAMAFWTKYHNMVDPATGKLLGILGPEPQTQAEAPATYGYSDVVDAA